MPRTLVSKRSGGTDRKSEATRTWLRMRIPADEPPMASTRGQVGGGPLQAVVDHPVVVVGIGLRAGRPGDLLAPDRPAVDDGRDLVVAGAEVEADAAAVEMAAREADRLAGFREGRGAVEGDLERLPVDAGHGPDVEGPGTAFGVLGLEAAADPGRSLEVDAPPAARPEQELDRALDHPVGGFGIGVFAGEGRVEDRDEPVLALDGQPQGPASGRPGPREVFFPGEDDRLEGRIARRRRDAPAVRHWALNSTFTGDEETGGQILDVAGPALRAGRGGRGGAALPAAGHPVGEGAAGPAVELEGPVGGGLFDRGERGREGRSRRGRSHRPCRRPCPRRRGSPWPCRRTRPRGPGSGGRGRTRSDRRDDDARTMSWRETALSAKVE